MHADVNTTVNRNVNAPIVLAQVKLRLPRVDVEIILFAELAAGRIPHRADVVRRTAGRLAPAIRWQRMFDGLKTPLPDKTPAADFIVPARY